MDILTSVGLLCRESGLLRPSPALAPFTTPEGALALRLIIRAPLLQGEHFLRQARSKGLSLDGWRYEDEEVIEAQAAITRLWAERSVSKLRFLPGLEASLNRPGAKLLDVGAGAAGLSITLCRHFPTLSAVALEPAAISADIGEHRVREAAYQNRITVRRERVEHLAERAEYDLAFVPQMFLPEPIIGSAVSRVFHALKPGGWLLAAVISRPGVEPSAAIARFKNLLWGGNSRTADQLKAILLKTGFSPVIRSPGGGEICMVCARRPAH
jgi:SAM-dependent methyltransferase